ncbi:MAG: cob(I)yrinic acid a,c-diamide adenosyltransferase [Polyangiaceae bacterium]|jgi:cob(I)alamin adenosyltransferase|nr:cob(I)yrinic acid a,c-diamide adenosyltransferase [Polyangiaceae bacterium]
MKIYTRTGDDGSTGLFGGSRVAKDDPRVEAYGTIDELNCAIGLARAHQAPAQIDAVLEVVQGDLFRLGAEIASGKNAGAKLGMSLIESHDVQRLEQAIDEAEAQLTPLRAFILPGGSVASAALHVARTVARRAERALVTLQRATAVRREVLVYVNRLSDLLFVLARYANHLAAQQDVVWFPPKP